MVSILMVRNVTKSIEAGAGSSNSLCSLVYETGGGR